MASTVLIRQRASAPAASTALATATMSVTLGVSFTIRGFFTASRTAAVTSAAHLGSVPKLMPPPWTLGQLMLSSIQPTWGQTSKRRQVSTYSSTEKPLTFARIGL